MVMPRFKITLKQPTYTNGVRLDSGMSVEVTDSFNNPISTDGGQVLQDTFFGMYGIDIRKAGALNCAYLGVKKVG